MKVHVRNKDGNLVPLEVLTLKGEKGEQGIQGIKGENGQDGVTPNITIGEVTTLEPGEKATVTREGTRENPVFNFGIPRGEKGADGISIDDSTISVNKTWSSSKIENFVLTNDNMVWTTVQGENLRIEYTKESSLKEVEILGNTIQGFADCVTNKQIVDSILSTGLDNKTRLNSDGTFTVDIHGFSSSTDWSNINKEGFIQLEPNTKYSVGCWRDNGAFPTLWYILYEENRIVNATGVANPTFTTGKSGKVLLYPASAQDGKLKIRVVKGDYKLTDYPYDFNLSVIQHLGELYVDDDGEPILDSQGRKQYKIEVESVNSIEVFWDKDKIKNGCVLNFNGIDVGYAGYFITDYLSVEGNTKYAINTNGANYTRFSYYDENKTFISTVDVRDTSSKQTPAKTRYMRVGVKNDLLDTLIIQAHVDRFNNDIVPPKSHKTTILIPCQLSKVGDISDRLYWDSSKGKYVVEKALTEKLTATSSNRIGDFTSTDELTGTGKYMTFLISGLPLGSTEFALNPSWKVVEEFHSGFRYYDGECINPVRDGFRIKILKSRLDTEDLIGFKNWLNSVGGINFERYKNIETIDTDITEELKLPTFINNTYISVSGGIQGSIKAKAPIDGGKVIGALQRKNTELKATNEVQDELINTTMLATDEMFMMLEPLLAEVVNLNILNERSVSKMVDMYVAMVQRGIKTIDQVPARYREQVKEVLAQLDN